MNVNVFGLLPPIVNPIEHFRKNLDLGATFVENDVANSIESVKIESFSNDRWNEGYGNAYVVESIFKEW